MTPKTLVALRASITHWQDIVDDPDNAKLGFDHCALCQEFHPSTSPIRQEAYQKDSSVMCLGCPVREATGQHGCLGSPYDQAELLAPDGWPEDASAETLVAKRQDFLWAARKELAFLKSLLPPGTTETEVKA